MKNADSRAALLCKMISAFAVGFIILISFSCAAFAYDDSYLGDGRYWNDKGEVVNFSKDNIEGCLKYYIDEKNGCAYFYLQFYDAKLSEKAEDFHLIFTVKNSSNSYVFSVNKNGVTADAEYNIDNNFDIYYDFSEFSSKYKGGEVFVAYELKNSVDKKLNNTVECKYLGSNGFDIIKDIPMDMLVTTTAKTTQVKTATEKTSKETTIRTTTEKTEKEATGKSTSASGNSSLKTTSKRSSAEESTKFVPSTTAKSSSSGKSSADNSTKFSAFAESEGVAAVSETDSLQQEDSVTAGTAGSYYNQSLEQGSSDNSIVSTHSSAGSRTLLAFGIIVFAAGVFLIAYGSLKDKYKIVSVEKEDSVDASAAKNSEDEK